MKRGEVRWYTFRAPDKRRPVLILTRTSAISLLTGITVAPRVRSGPRARISGGSAISSQNQGEGRCVDMSAVGASN